MESRSHGNVIPIGMLLGSEQPGGFFSEIKGASVGGWKKKKKGRSMEM